MLDDASSVIVIKRGNCVFVLYALLLFINTCEGQLLIHSLTTYLCNIC